MELDYRAIGKRIKIARIKSGFDTGSISGKSVAFHNTHEQY